MLVKSLGELIQITVLAKNNNPAKTKTQNKPSVAFCWVLKLKEFRRGIQQEPEPANKKMQNSTLGGRGRGSKTSPTEQQSCWMYSAVSCNFTRSNLSRRVQFCNSFKLTSAGTASAQPPRPSLHWCKPDPTVQQFRGKQ